MPSDAPAWAANATPSESFWRGLTAIASAPGLVLFATSLGFGALARDLGFTFGQAFYLTLAMFALPAQVTLIDQMARGASLAAIAFAVTLTAVRLLPMTVSMMPLIRSKRAFGPLLLLGVHCVAATSWLEGNRRLPKLPEALRLPHHLGVGLATMTSTVIGTCLGFGVAATLPTAVAATLLFMTPVYFLFSLAIGAVRRLDWYAIGTGLTLGPLMFLMMPGPDLMLTGIVGGSIAYALDRRRR